MDIVLGGVLFLSEDSFLLEALLSTLLSEDTLFDKMFFSEETTSCVVEVFLLGGVLLFSLVKDPDGPVFLKLETEVGGGGSWFMDDSEMGGVEFLLVDESEGWELEFLLLEERGTVVGVEFLVEEHCLLADCLFLAEPPPRFL